MLVTLNNAQKFVIELPKMAKEAVAIYNKNRNTYWQDAIAKEAKNVKVAFQILINGKKAPKLPVF